VAGSEPRPYTGCAGEMRTRPGGRTRPARRPAASSSRDPLLGWCSRTAGDPLRGHACADQAHHRGDRKRCQGRARSTESKGRDSGAFPARVAPGPAQNPLRPRV